MSKLNVAVFFGGKSAEHEISLISAQNVIKSLDRQKYIPILIAIDQTGKWYYQSDEALLFVTDDPKKIKILDKSAPVILSPVANDHRLFHSESLRVIDKVDIIYPVLHGTYGEDGAIQGLAKMANLPCVGCGILGSSVGMDKEIMKRVLSANGINNAPYVTIRRNDNPYPDYKEVSNKLGNHLFVKPANMGSSVGITYVKKAEDYPKALEYAFQYDNKIIIESKVNGREVECAVMGNLDPKASIVGEVIPKDGFYSYESKYIDEGGAVLEVPAKISGEELKKIQKLSITTYKVLECRGISRVDMFLTPSGECFVNEINTLPGFTKISMYPMLWKLSGVPIEALVDQLIQYAIKEHQDMENLEVTFK
ncbi:MAG: D-alanine--D-alanine ligase family protein [Saprospiraceae bacterium]